MHADADGTEPTLFDYEIGPGRLTAFSDGVLAVIITITALSIRPPDGTDFDALSDRFPGALIYALSFAMVGIYWNNHHHLLRASHRVSGSVMWANLHLLFWLSFLPIVTEWVGNDYASMLPAAAYGAIAFLSAVAYAVLVYALRRTDRDFARLAASWGHDVKGLASPAIYALGFGLAFLPLGPWLAYACYVAVAIMWFVPDRRLDF